MEFCHICLSPEIPLVVSWIQLPVSWHEYSERWRNVKLLTEKKWYDELKCVCVHVQGWFFSVFFLSLWKQSSLSPRSQTLGKMRGIWRWVMKFIFYFSPVVLKPDFTWVSHGERLKILMLPRPHAQNLHVGWSGRSLVTDYPRKSVSVSWLFWTRAGAGDGSQGAATVTSAQSLCSKSPEGRRGVCGWGSNVSELSKCWDLPNSAGSWHRGTGNRASAVLPCLSFSRNSVAHFWMDGQWKHLWGDDSLLNVTVPMSLRSEWESLELTWGKSFSVEGTVVAKRDNLTWCILIQPSFHLF